MSNVLFTVELARRLKDDKVYVNAVHPGYVNTELQRNIPGWQQTLLTVPNYIVAKTPEGGALTSLYVATSPEIEEKGITGQYFVPTAKLSKAKVQAKDPELAKKLWTFSEKLVADILKEKKESDNEEEEEEGKEEKKKEEKEEKEEKKKEEKKKEGKAESSSSSGEQN